MTRDTQDPRPVLYVIGCGAPQTGDLPALVRHAQDAGWEVCAVLTPMAERFVDVDALAELTGRVVRSQYKQPGDADVFPQAAAMIVAPATFNTVNKIAHGISDTLAVGLVCEGLGASLPVLIVPWQNRALGRHPAYARSISYLREAGAHLVLTERTEPVPAAEGPSEPFPWDQVHEALDKIQRMLPTP